MFSSAGNHPAVNSQTPLETDSRKRDIAHSLPQSTRSEGVAYPPIAENLDVKELNFSCSSEPTPGQSLEKI